MKRDNSLDSLKYIAMMEVIFIHFMYFFDEALLVYIRNTFPYALLFNGLSAKVGLAVLAVIAGFFSCRNKKNKSLVLYSVKKYLYYFLYCLVANLIYCLIDHDNQFAFSLPDIFIKSLLLKEDYYYYLWFVRSFFIGNILSFLMGKFEAPVYIPAVLFVILVFTREQYIAVFMLGSILSALVDNDPSILHNKYVHLVFVAIIFILQKIETQYSYTLYGLIGVLLFILIRNSRLLHEISKNSFTAFFGRKTMPILLVHYGCMYVFERLGINSLPIIYVLWMILTHISAYLISVPLEIINKKMNELIDSLSA